MKKIFIWLFCRKNKHKWLDKSNLDDAWHECKYCGKQVDYTDKEYNNLKFHQPKWY